MHFKISTLGARIGAHAAHSINGYPRKPLRKLQANMVTPGSIGNDVRGDPRALFARPLHACISGGHPALYVASFVEAWIETPRSSGNCPGRSREPAGKRQGRSGRPSTFKQYLSAFVLMVEEHEKVARELDKAHRALIDDIAAKAKEIMGLLAQHRLNVDRQVAIEMAAREMEDEFTE